MPGEPLPKEDFSLRHQTREFAVEFAATVQKAADDIADSTSDRRIKEDTLRWKIGAVSAVRQAALRTSPTVALVELGAICRQMTAFFADGAGQGLFGPGHAQALTNAHALEARFTAIARGALSPAEWKKLDLFLTDYVREHPLRTLSFFREPAAGHWETLHGETRPTPTGTTAEAMADLSDRVHMLTDQVPSELRWRLTLASGGLEDALAETRQTLRDIDAAMKSIAATASAAPATLSNAVVELRGLAPAFTGLEKQWNLTLGVVERQRAALAQDLSSEREAIVKAVDQQRAAIMKEVDQQRAAIMKEVEHLAADAVDRSMQHARATIREVLLYAILALLIALGLPFGFGFVAGRATSRNRRSAEGPASSVDRSKT